MNAEPFTFGTHNLHDEAGVPTFFADVIIFTEAIAPTIRAKVKQRWADARAQLAGYRIVVCPQQRDLVVAVRRRLFAVDGTSYTKYVDGRPRVTPNRGTFVVLTTHRPTGRPVAVVAEHRINAAFPPYVRGEPAFRKAAWRRHTDGTLDTIARLGASRFRALAGGDVNTPRNIDGYPGLSEVGQHFDRLAASTWAKLGNVTVKSRKGSDHPRLVATVRL